GRLGAVVIVFHSQDEAAVAGHGAEETAASGIFKQLAHLRREFHGGRDMFRIEVGFIEVEQGGDHEGIVVQEDVNCCFAISKAAQQAAGLRVIHTVQYERCCALRRREIALVIEYLGGLRKGRNHESVP